MCVAHFAACQSLVTLHSKFTFCYVIFEVDEFEKCLDLFVSAQHVKCFF